MVCVMRGFCGVGGGGGMVEGVERGVVVTGVAVDVVVVVCVVFGVYVVVVIGD